MLHPWSLYFCVLTNPSSRHLQEVSAPLWTLSFRALTSPSLSQLQSVSALRLVAYFLCPDKSLYGLQFVRTISSYAFPCPDKPFPLPTPVGERPSLSLHLCVLIHKCLPLPSLESEWILAVTLFLCPDNCLPLSFLVCGCRSVGRFLAVS